MWFPQIPSLDLRDFGKFGFGFAKNRRAHFFLVLTPGNTIKLSYSCCRNTGSFIARHNRRVIQLTSNNHGCSCRNKAEFPFEKKCSNADIGYKAVISAHSEPDKKYFGIAEITFKDQLRNYTRDF